MALLHDQIGNQIELEEKPLRIVCLVPSITEYLYDLGLDDRVVGITKFCVHPVQWRKEKQIIGGTKQQNLDEIRSLQPDLIIASKEENVKSYIVKLWEHCPVYVSDVDDLTSAIDMMKDVAVLTGKEKEGDEITQAILQKFNLLKSQADNLIEVSYCIWRNPWMWAGTDTFISKMLSYAGFKNVISTFRYPEIEMSEMIAQKPEYIFLSSEPFPFGEPHIDELKEKYPDSKFIIVDGEMFSWYGSRMLKAPDYFNSLFNKLKTKRL